jgi:hypothetical protein
VHDVIFKNMPVMPDDNTYVGTIHFEHMRSLPQLPDVMQFYRYEEDEFLAELTINKADIVGVQRTGLSDQFILLTRAGRYRMMDDSFDDEISQTNENRTVESRVLETWLGFYSTHLDAPTYERVFSSSDVQTPPKPKSKKRKVVEVQRRSKQARMIPAYDPESDSDDESESED